MTKVIPKLVPNSRYNIHVNLDDTSSKHEVKYEVYWENHSHLYSWRAFYLIDIFDTKEEAEALIERLKS